MVLEDNHALNDHKPIKNALFIKTALIWIMQRHKIDKTPFKMTKSPYICRWLIIRDLCISRELSKNVWNPEFLRHKT